MEVIFIEEFERKMGDIFLNGYMGTGDYRTGEVYLKFASYKLTNS